MKFDLEWLIDQLEESPPADELAEKLTDCGFLVELREQVDGGEVWDIEVTTNRPDAMNHRGLAREAAVACGIGLKPVSFTLEENDEPAEQLVTVEIDAPDACTRFCSRVVRGVDHRPSPEWLQQRLERCGVRPISAVVDVTNYILLTLGQPLHAYDLHKVRGAKLVARMAGEGEKLTTLDGEERILTAEMPVIADGEGVVGLAGVMGGAESEIGPETTDVWLEAAHFDALKVRRMARRLGMHTEASHRFERGADPEMPPLAVDLAAAMIAELAGGTVCRGRIDVNPSAFAAHAVTMDLDRLSAFAGLEISHERAIQILEALDFDCDQDGVQLSCTVPSHRIDVERTADLYEEVIRHVGYNNVPSELPVLSATPGRRHANWQLIDRARQAAVDSGLAEVMTFSFVDAEADALCETLRSCPGRSLPLDNPLAATQGTMRRSLLPGLLSAARENLNQGERSLALFEQGRVFAYSGEHPLEAERLAVVLAGANTTCGTDQMVDFPQLKGIVESTLDRLGFPPVQWRRGGAPWLDPAEGADLCTADEKVVGIAGAVAAEIAARWEMKTQVYVAEIDLGAALEDPPVPQFRPLPRFPAVITDMTVEHQQDLDFATLEAAVREHAGEHAESVELRARYTGKGLPDGAVRTTLRVVYRHPERSFTQEEVNGDHQDLRARLAERLGVVFA